MTVDAIIPEVWSALVKEELERSVPWLQVVEDLSAEITMGNQVHISQIITSFDTETQGQAGTTGAQPSTGGPSIGEYTRDNGISYGLTQAADITLDLDQQKYWALRVDDLDALQTRPDLMQRNVARAMRAMGRVVNDRVRAVFTADGSTSRANSDGTPFVDPTYAKFHNESENYLGVSKSANARSGGGMLAGKDYDNLFNRGSADYWLMAQAFIHLMMDAKERADNAFWPEESRYCMMSPQVKNRIIEYITDQKPNLGAGMIIDEAFTNGAGPGKIFGFKGIIDPGITKLLSTDTGQAAGVKKTLMYFGLMNDGLAYAAQVQKVEALRLQTHFADAIRGLYVYGSGMIMDDRSHVAGFNVFT